MSPPRGWKQYPDKKYISTANGDLHAEDRDAIGIANGPIIGGLSFGHDHSKFWDDFDGYR